MIADMFTATREQAEKALTTDEKICCKNYKIQPKPGGSGAINYPITNHNYNDSITVLTR